MRLFCCHTHRDWNRCPPQRQRAPKREQWTTAAASRTESGTDVSLILWDLEGTDNLNEIRSSYLLGTHAIVYVFDVSRPSTFKNLRENLSIVRKRIDGVPIKVVGNKGDLKSADEVAKLLNDYNIAYDYLTSAKTGSQVDDLFERLAKTLVHDAETIQGKL